MTKCKTPSCTKEVGSIEGRRPKEFCSVECRTKFHNSKNKKEGSKRGRPAGAKNKSKDELRDYDITFHNKEAMSQFEKAIAGAVGENKEAIDSSVQDLLTKNVSVTKTELVDGKVKITKHTYPPFEVKPQSEWGSEMNAIALPVIEPKNKWNFEGVVFLQIEDFTEYPKAKCPAGGFERTEYLSKKKEADDKIRDAWNKRKV